ncbi:TonB-dependent siderophore receptor [Salinisphaera sp. LB1]|uniref:TonB-dependent receptor plug domain-containing protein n=1 Tax=Salinisphaera sp. LB1 TaxID=2183911 RepID=UPI000D707A90|nr:TonB-dependent receptor [Salinisphaera sp. LB1]AWN16096.1 TonB-dependent receptor [Salinisphaera sp. LB1]
MRRYSVTVWGGVFLGAAAPVSAQTAAPEPDIVAAPAASAPTTKLAPLAVRGLISRADHVQPPLAPSTVDTAAAMNEVPGGALVDNGGISGQVQFRGLTGYRNQTRIDGMSVASGGPNWMDPPLHYAPAALVESLSVTRGIPSVADSIDTIGTSVDARTRQSRYAGGDSYELHGWGEATAQSVDDGYSLSGQASLANDSNRIGLTAVTDQGAKLRTPQGRLRASSYDRKQYGLDFGHREAWGETSGFVRAQRTGDTGNPDLPMDIHYFRSTLAELKQTADIGRTQVTAQLDFNHVEHEMDNYILRPAPDFSPLNGDAPDPRYIRARSQRYAAKLHAAHPLAGGSFKTGFDGSWVQYDAFVGNPKMAAFGVNAFDDIRRDTYSLFGQWAGPIRGPWHGELGVRDTIVHTAAGPGGVAPSLPMPAQRLAADFAASDRDHTDNNVDVVAKLSRDIGQRWQARLGLARKTRSPYYTERYAYIPLEATAGSADGNNTIGNTRLSPEVAYMADLGLSFIGSRLTFSPEVYYHRIHDYITGVPYAGGNRDVVMVSTVNGDPTPLQYANVGAEIYGADLAAAYKLDNAWTLSGGAGYTRGRRTDTGDNLYRIAPANMRARLAYQRADWRLSLSERYVFAPHHIADSHRDARLGDPETGGYAVTDITARYQASPLLWVEVGVDNLFNRGYRDFMGGFNRVADSAVPLGARLPGAGRNAHATVHVAF